MSKFDKKLQLNKEIISELGNMDNIYGGADVKDTVVVCPISKTADRCTPDPISAFCSPTS